MRARKEALDRAEKVLGVRFRRRRYLEAALTHPSFTFEAGTTAVYERLEFLGDAVLGLVITEYIFRAYPDFEEGQLAKLRSGLVNGKILASMAGRLDLGSVLFVGKGAEQSGTRHSTAVLADVIEAVIGAIYLDRGLRAVRRFVLGLYGERLNPGNVAALSEDYKSQLQERTMAEEGLVPHYVIAKEEGPPHSKTFYAEVRIDGEVCGSGTGPSKKSAEQEAAKEAWHAGSTADRAEQDGVEVGR